MTIDLTPEHTARKQGSDKDLHPEVIAAYRYIESVLDSADVPSSKLGGPLWFGWALREAFLAGCSHAARSALDQPEPEGPTESDLSELFYRHVGEGSEVGFENAIAEALARWGRPAVEPVLVSERLPGSEDCWPDGHEKVGCCWLWTPVDGLGRWEVQHRYWASEPGESYTHWLPYYALPVRTPTETNGQT